MRGIECPYCLQGRHHRNLERRCEAPQVARRVAFDDTPSGINQWPLALAENVEKRSSLGLRHARAVQILHPLSITSKVQHAFTPEGAFPVLHVFRNIQTKGSGTIADGNYELG